MSEAQQTDLVRELRLFRAAFWALTICVAVYVGLQISMSITRPPSGNSQELRDIQSELRMLRQELSKPRNQPIAPPIVIRGGKAAEKAEDKDK